MADKVRVLVIENLEDFSGYKPDIELEFFQKKNDMDELMEAHVPEPDVVVWIEPEQESDMTIEELAQLLRTCYVTQPIFALMRNAIEEEMVRTMVKNGFNSVFQLGEDVEKTVAYLFADFLPKPTDVNDSLLVVGEKDLIKDQIPSTFTEEKITVLPVDDDVLDEPISVQPAAVVFVMPLPGEKGADLSSGEVGQILQAVYPNSHRFLIFRGEAGFDRGALKKNGFTDVFLHGVDDNLVRKYLRDASFAVQGKTLFHPVSLVDIREGAKLNFDLYIYMTMRNKYIKFVRKGRDIEAHRLKRLNEHNGEVFVPAHQMDDFYQFCSEYLKEIGSDDTVSSTETRDKLKEATRELFSNIFSKSKSFEEGSEVLDQVNGIVDSFLGKSHQKVKEKTQGLFSNMSDLYLHSANVSSMAATLSMVTGLGDPQEMATAGLLMDLGLMKLPPEISAKKVEELSFEQFDVYKTHPELSLSIINEKKMKISDAVRKYIRNHHEYFNGKGFPKALSGPKITSEEAMITLADIIVARVAEKRKETPEEMIKGLHHEMKTDFDNMKVEPTFIKKFIPLFTTSPD